MDRRFVVQYQDGSYMVLQGPFAYQFATKDLQQATLMFRSQATAWADVWKAFVVQVG